MNGPQPLAFHEIWAWSALTGQRPTPTEVQMLKRMDGALIEANAEEQDSVRQIKESKSDGHRRAGVRN